MARNLKEIQAMLRIAYPGFAEGKIRQNSGQFNIFANRMSEGDTVLMPRRGQGVVAVGRIAGPYRFDPKGPDGFRHSRQVTWNSNPVARSSFDSELLHKLNAATTFCGITGDGVEARVGKAIGATLDDSASAKKKLPSVDLELEDEIDQGTDWDQQARDEIHKLVQQRFKGHDLERLIDEILKAQDYTTHRSPVGADKGIDILAARGPLGFEDPRLAVQIKSESTPIGRLVLDQLIGAMQNFHAANGLLVSWSGFKDTITKETAAQFFRVRLWTAEDVVRELLNVNERLSESMRAEIPLKRIWVVAETEDTD